MPRTTLFLLLFALLYAIPRPLQAGLPDLARYRSEAHANGPVAYLGLRHLWKEWERDDPATVEEALRALSQDPAIRPPIRAYAEVLVAYARRRRGDLEGSRAILARLGFISRWMIVGPFGNEGKAGLDAPYEPEQLQHEPIVPTRSLDGFAHRPVSWRIAPPVTSDGWIDMGTFFRPQENTCSYVLTFVHDSRKDPPAMRPITLWAGSGGAMKVFWNGQVVLRDPRYRSIDPDRFAVEVPLLKGYNRLLVKLCGEDSSPMLALRLADADGVPDPFLEVDSDPRRSTPAAGAVPRQSSWPAQVARVARVKGTLQAFEQLAQSDAPADLEAFARFLIASDADDPKEHRARTMANRAAEKAPTIQRLLLAGEQAEGRNPRAVWLEKAEALVGPNTTEADQLAVLFVRASHTRSGPNPRSSKVLFDRALAIDPEHVPSLVAEAELLQDAGLSETALALLETGLLRRPRSIALLRLATNVLRGQDRMTEASEMAERYAALRCDDASFMRSRIDLATARRDRGAAVRWIERLIMMNPDSAGALQTASAAFLALGDPSSAIGVLRKALDFAPDDTDTMSRLADTYGLAGQPDEQRKLLKRLLELRPQAKDVRDYVAHSEPSKARRDEAYARPSSEFLAKRGEPANGKARRTLVDLQVTTVFPSGLASRFHQVAFQPLTEASAATSAEYDIAFESESQTVQLRGARVYRANGTVDEANETGLGAADDPSISMYTSARVLFVRFPRLQPGDVVELLYRVEDIAHRNAFADYFGEVVYLQSSVPVGRAEYVLITPKSRSFSFNEARVPGLVKTVEEQGDERITRFVAERLDAVETETNMAPLSEILGHVHVSTYRTWDEVGRWYWGLVRDQLTPDDEVRRRAHTLTRGLTDERAKVRAIYEFVVQNTRYVALEFGIHGYKPYRAAQIFARGFGDCKDKASLIVTMLGELGIGAKLVLVRTGHRGRFESSPASLAPFDHAIAYVPSLNLYLDGTAEWTGTKEFPAMDRGAMALVVDQEGGKLVELPDPPASESRTTQRIEVTAAADGKADLDWRIDVTGVDAPGWRGRYHAAATRPARLQQLVSTLFGGAEVISTSVQGNLDDIEGAVSLKVRARGRSFARREGNLLSIPAGPREYLVRDFAPTVQRRLDTKLYAAWSTEQEYVIHLPQGAKVRSLPRASAGTGSYGSYRVEVEAGGNTVRVKTAITMTRSRVPVGQYAGFRTFCEEVDRALGQRVVAEVR